MVWVVTVCIIALETPVTTLSVFKFTTAKETFMLIGSVIVVSVPELALAAVPNPCCSILPSLYFV